MLFPCWCGLRWANRNDVVVCVGVILVSDVVTVFVVGRVHRISAVGRHFLVEAKAGREVDEHVATAAEGQVVTESLLFLLQYLLQFLVFCC